MVRAPASQLIAARTAASKFSTDSALQETDGEDCIPIILNEAKAVSTSRKSLIHGSLVVVKAVQSSVGVDYFALARAFKKNLEFNGQTLVSGFKRCFLSLFKGMLLFLLTFSLRIKRPQTFRSGVA